MALSGSFTNYFQGNASRFHMTTSWSATQNIANNTSTITAITTIRPEGAFAATASKNGSITIAGNRKDFTFVLGSVGAGVTKEVGRHTVTVSHASNGDGSAGIASTLDINITYSGKNLGSLSTSGNASLNKIPRTSTFTIPSSFTVGSAFTVSISRADSSFTHWVRLSDGSTSLFDTDSSVGTSQSVNVAASTLIARMASVKSKTLTVTVWTYSGGTVIGNTSKTITANIPISTFTIPTSFTMGNAFTTSISRVGTLTHWVRLSDGSTSLFDTDSSVGTSQSVNVALSTLAARSPNAMSRTFTVTVWTYNGNTVIGSTSKNITANVPADLKPTFSAVTVSENVSSVASLVGAYVQTKSKLNLAITGASGIHGSTIKSYNITGVGHNVNSSSTVTGLLSVSGKQTITGTIIDSRGQPFSKPLVVNILPYTPPTLTGLSFKRTTKDKIEAPLGNYVTVGANVKVHDLTVNGVQKNSIKYQVQSAQSGGSFADKANTTATGLTESYSDAWVGYSVDHSYNFRVRVGDVFGFGSWSVGVVPTGIVTQQWGSKTTSFGKMIDSTSYNVQVGTGGIQSDGGYYAGNNLFHKGYINIPQNGNLNNYTEPGWYSTGSSANSATIANTPNNKASIVEVLPNFTYSDITQRLTNYDTGDMFWRTRYNGTWYPWATVSKNGHKHAAGDINSGTFADARIPSLNASKITAGTIADARLPAKAKPADFVVEIGSNTNGSWEKWNSGKLVQWGQKTVSGIMNLSWGSGSNIYYFEGDGFTYPLPFTNALEDINSTVSMNHFSGTTPTMFISDNNETKTKTANVYIGKSGNVSSSNTTVKLKYEAIGRWK